MTKRLMILACLVAVLSVSGGLWWTQRGAAAVPAVYVGLGASDSVGVGADRPLVEGWVPRVHAALPAGTQLVNLGISGATLDDIIRDELPPALDAQPRWVTLWAGVNDLRAGVTLPTFQQQLDAALQPFAHRPDTTVLVLNLPNLRYLPAFSNRAPANLDATMQSWNAAIADAAQKHGAILVDLYTHGPELAAHPEYISADGFHPSSAGYARIAAYVVDALKNNATTATQ